MNFANCEISSSVRETRLNMPLSFNKDFYCVDPNITHIAFGIKNYDEAVGTPDLFNSKIIKVPHRLKELYLNDNYNQSIEKGILPVGLKKLVFGSCYNQKIENDVLPPTLKYLEFDDDYDTDIDANVLPKKLKTLIFGLSFNKLIVPGVLPPSIKFLGFGQKFCQEILENSLPLNLEVLEFGNACLSSWYDKPLKKNILPKNLQKLIIGSYAYDHSLIESLPTNCKTLQLPLTECTINVLNNLPPIETLIIVNVNPGKKNIISNLPLSLKDIIIDNGNYYISSSENVINHEEYIKVPFGCKVTYVEHWVIVQ